MQKRNCLLYTSFGVHSIDELPVLNEDQVEEFKHQAEQEAEMKLEV